METSKKQYKKVLITGNFNVLHPGHLRLLRFAKECGEYLIVAVSSDEIAGNAAHVTDSLRLEGVNSNNWVDEAFIYRSSIQEIIKELKPDIVVKGQEHQNTYNPEQEVLDSYGGKLVFGSGQSIFSSLDLLTKDFNASLAGNLNIPTDFIDRHKIKKDNLRKLIKDFSKIRVCVLGDLILDEYITCEPLGMSQEDPTIVVTPIDSTKFIGGAGIVAAHASGLGAKVHLLSISGVDESSEFSKKELESHGVNCHIIEDQSRPTTLKQRYRSKGKSLLRVSHLHQNAISEDLQAIFFDKFSNLVDEIDLIVFSDFNYGALPQELVNKVTCLAKKKNIFISADSQSSSQIGDISRFKDMDLITPTEREARVSERNNEDGLVVLAEKLKSKSLANNLFLKLGEEGMIIYPNEDDLITDRLPAFNNSPKDTAGAGDSLLITSSLSLACKANIWEAAFLGSLSAGIQIGRVGNIPLRAKELLIELDS